MALISDSSVFSQIPTEATGPRTYWHCVIWCPCLAPSFSVPNYKLRLDDSYRIVEQICVLHFQCYTISDSIHKSEQDLVTCFKTTPPVSLQARLHF